MTTDTDDTPTERGDAASPERVARLEREYADAGRPFARVTVVRREPPVSANVGDRAIVTPDGDLVGWVGGAACARSVAVREATAALRTGEPKLIGLAPDPDDVDRPGLAAFPMTCHSGGTLELFVDPVLPTPRLVVVGDTPISRAVVRFAGQLTYDVTAVPGEDAADVPGADETVAAADADALAAAVDGADAVVVASMGEIDDAGVEAGVRAGVPYVGLVASERRGAELFERVAARTGDDVAAVADAVACPAGLDIGARTPEEIAVSLLAELVAARRERGTEAVRGSGDDATGAADAAADASDAADAAADASDTTTGPDAHGPTDPDDMSVTEPDEGTAADADEATAADADEVTEIDEATPETAVDPVCGMDVVVGEAAATVERGGETYHFCGQGCADAFVDDPDRFLDAAGVSGGE